MINERADIQRRKEKQNDQDRGIAVAPHPVGYHDGDV
jgi:hypothetical protein